VGFAQPETEKVMAVSKKPDAAAQRAEVPFSEDASKLTVASRRELIADLRRLVEAEPTRVISRNYYRVNGRYAESAWTGVFGTFAEFKKQANVTPSRHVQALEKQVAKHASVERIRVLSEERKGYAERYLIPDKRRFQTHVVVSDIHDRRADPFVVRVLLDTLERIQPSRFIEGGDTFDLPEFGKYAIDPREWDVTGRIQWVREFHAEVRRRCPNTQIDVLEGNHEHRLLRHLAEASPAMRAVLADLHGFTVPKLLCLDEFGINYVARSDLATFTQADVKREVAKNYLIVDGAFLVHHFPEGMAMGFPGMHGHHHKHIAWPHYSPVFGSFTWHQLGCVHRREASYCAGEKWANGFMIAHVDTLKKHTALEYVEFQEDHVVVGGKWYERSESERFVHVKQKV
jgi:hypothetical protein